MGASVLFLDGKKPSVRDKKYNLPTDRSEQAIMLVPMTERGRIAPHP